MLTGSIVFLLSYIILQQLSDVTVSRIAYDLPLLQA